MLMMLAVYFPIHDSMSGINNKNFRLLEKGRIYFFRPILLYLGYVTALIQSCPIQ